jgi:hypothetical protein
MRPAPGRPLRRAARPAPPTAPPRGAIARAAVRAASLSATLKAKAATLVVTYKASAVADAVSAQMAALFPPGSAATLGGTSSPSSLNLDAAARRAARLRALSTLKASVLGTGGEGAAAPLSGVKAADGEALAHLPVSVVMVSTKAALAALRADPRVASVVANERLEQQMMESLPLINQPAAAAAGYTGAGCAVAVLDTGEFVCVLESSPSSNPHSHPTSKTQCALTPRALTTNPPPTANRQLPGANYFSKDLGSCTAVGQPSTCRVKFARDFTFLDPDGKMPYDDGMLDDFLHGTNTASTVARVAPGADILALDVFFPDGYAYLSDLLFAINWCGRLRRAGVYGGALPF